MKNLSLIFTAAAAAVLAAASPARSQAVIEFKPQATVRGQTVTLADIAVVRNAAGEDARRLGGLEIAASPRPGEAREIAREYVRQRLTQENAGDGVVLEGADSVSVRRASRQLTAAQIDEKVREYCAGGMNDGDSLEVEIRRAALTVPDDDFSVRVEGRLPKPPYSGKALLFVKVFTGDEMAASLPVTVSLRRFGRVLAAAQNIERGRRILDGDIELREIEMTRDLARAAVDPSQALGRTAKCSIMAGQVIDSTMLVNPDVIRRNDVVSAVFESQGMRVACKAVAKEGGAAGDFIHVSNLSSKKDIYGQVISAQEVRIAQ